MPQIINNIYKDYNIYYAFVEYYTPKYLYSELEDLKKKGCLKDYYKISQYNNLYKHFKSLKNILHLKKIKFDTWLTMNETEIINKFVKNIIINNNCKKIILWPQITYLFNHTVIANKYLDINSNQSLNIEVTHSFLDKVFKKLKTLNIFIILISIFNIIYNKYKLFSKKLKNKYLNLYCKILFFIFFKKKLEFGKFDNLTQLGSGKVDYILFCDPKEVEAHSRLFNNINVKLVKHTGRGYCRCKEINKNRKYILIPLSTPINVDTIPSSELDLYLSAINIAKKEMNFDQIHLRPHPRDYGKWSEYLNNFLIKNNINCKLVSNKEPIWKIACEYEGIIGESSNALRDAANSCENCFVIGLEKLSFHRYDNPRFVFGLGRNIYWIDKDGNYDSRIFKKQKRIYDDNESSLFDYL